MKDPEEGHPESNVKGDIDCQVGDWVKAIGDIHGDYVDCRALGQQDDGNDWQDN